MTEARVTDAASADCLVNGQSASHISPLDRGLAYGDGLFETMRVVGGHLPLADYHFARLELGALRLRMRPDIALLRSEAEALARQRGDGIIKLILTRGLGPRGYAPPAEQNLTRILLAGPAPMYSTEHAGNGVRLFACQTRLGCQPLLAGIKHLNRLEQVLARAEWNDDRFAEGLVCDWQGRPIECTMSNLFVRAGGRWITPLLDDCGVQGVMRDYLIDALGKAGERVDQRKLEMSELLAGEEVFCCNSVLGVWPVVALGDRRWEVGTHTRAAQALAAQVYM